jgi:hypothetical protein
VFDWIRFCETHGVRFVTSGPNVSRDHIGIRCPFCGSADRSEHMQISLSGKGWKCWRNERHKGKSRSKLIRAILGCSNERARELAGERSRPVISDTRLDDEVRASLSGKRVRRTYEGPLALPNEFRPLTQPGLYAKHFWLYLYNRGYTNVEITWLSDNYHLMYATRGDYAYRIIIPVFDRYGDLRSWTSRTISKTENLRYKSVSGKTRDWVLGLPLLWSVYNPKRLVICEGPFDALRVSALGHKRGVYGTCLFGLAMTSAQARLLRELSERFRSVCFLLDEDAELRTFGMLEQLGVSGCVRLKLPVGVKDPGELDADGLDRVLEGLNQGAKDYDRRSVSGRDHEEMAS